MPICILLTNVPDSNIPKSFEVQLSELVADVLEKPIEKISVSVQSGQRLVRAGTSEVTCLLQIWSIGVFSPEKNSDYATKLYPFLSKNLGIENERIAVLFHDITADQVGKPSLL